MDRGTNCADPSPRDCESVTRPAGVSAAPRRAAAEAAAARLLWIRSIRAAPVHNTAWRAGGEGMRGKRGGCEHLGARAARPAWRLVACPLQAMGGRILPLPMLVVQAAAAAAAARL